MTKNQTVMKFNLDGLDDFKKQMGSDHVTRVGILAATNQRDDDADLTNSEIGAVHEFGSKSGKIPERSFLRMPLRLKAKDLMKGLSSSAAKAAFASGDFKGVYEILGVKAEEIVQNAFSSGGFGFWPSLSQITINRKGSSAILIDQGELRRAVMSDVINKSELK